MPLFSERYGYVKPSEVIIRETLTEEIKNSILSSFDYLEKCFNENLMGNIFSSMDQYVWVYFRHQRYAYWDRNTHCIEKFMINNSHQWYEKLDLLEYCIQYLYNLTLKNKDMHLQSTVEQFVQLQNENFERLHFGYRIVNNEIVEVTSEEEIRSIETAIQENKDNVKMHLGKALELYAEKPLGDYRNSIKESISAVEAFCREKTGQQTLGKALNELEKNSIHIPQLLKSAFEKLYAYTNQPDTGIRHALLDDANTPQAEEALFMLVSCSAFINYLNKKI